VKAVPNSTVVDIQPKTLAAARGAKASALPPSFRSAFGYPDHAFGGERNG